MHSQARMSLITASISLFWPAANILMIGGICPTRIRLEKATKLCLRRLHHFSYWEKTLLWATHSLEILYPEQRKLDKAEKMYMQAPEGCEKALKAKHM